MPRKNFIGLNEQSVVDDGAKPETRGDELCLIAFAGAASADERVYGIGFERLNQFAYDITKYPHCFALHPYLQYKGLPPIRQYFIVERFESGRQC